MQVIGRKKIDEAIRAHSEWKASLNSWYRITSGAAWKNFPDVRKTYKSADLVGSSIVFNIAHNRARLIALINYEMETVIIERIQPHADYDRA